jgi:ubiquinone biosynthesis protein UbiJ
MSIKEKVVSEGMKLASHPAVAPLLQDERVMKLLMTALSVPGKIEELTEEQRQNFIKLMGVASQQDVADLKRAVRSLEEEVSRLRLEMAETVVRDEG